MNQQQPSFLNSLVGRLSKRLLGLLPESDLNALVEKGVITALEKRNNPEETWQYNLAPFANYQVQPGVKQKPEGRVTYDSLRNFSVHYPIARACIDYLKTKIIKLNYTVTTNDGTKVKQDDPRVTVAMDFFHAPLGKRSKYREMIESIVEDYLVLGAFCLERMRTRGGQFLGEFKVVDASTIQLIVDEYGRIPEPPNPAYKQIIAGSPKADLTQDDLLYVKRANRSNSPYGLGPLESIIIQAESAMQGAMYNLRFFTDGNTPEGFGEVPEGWKMKDIKEFQTYFDAMMSGNPTMQRKIKMVPKGFNYMPTKKSTDMGFDRFELWLLQQTCAVFGVPPQDIGFTVNINKSTGEVQQNLGEERGMRPLAQMLEEVFTDVINDDLGFKNLRFQYTDLDPVDAKEEAEVNQIRLNSGIVSVDEIREEEGLPPIGLGHYVAGTPTLVTNLIQQKPKDQVNDGKKPKDDSNNGTITEDTDPEVDDAQKAEMRTWMKQSKNAYRQGRPFKKFVSNVLDDWMVEEVFTQLGKIKSKEDIEKVFSPYLNSQMQTAKTLEKLTHVLTELSA